MSLTLPTESGTLATKQKVEEQLAGKLDIIQPSANTRYVYSTHYSAVTSQNPQPLAISTGNASVNTLPMYIKVDNPAFDLPLESQKATFLVATPLYNAQCANKEYVDQFGIEIVR